MPQRPPLNQPKPWMRQFLREAPRGHRHRRIFWIVIQLWGWRPERRHPGRGLGVEPRFARCTESRIGSGFSRATTSTPTCAPPPHLRREHGETLRARLTPAPHFRAPRPAEESGQEITRYAAMPQRGEALRCREFAPRPCPRIDQSSASLERPPSPRHSHLPVPVARPRSAGESFGVWTGVQYSSERRKHPAARCGKQDVEKAAVRRGEKWT